MKKAKILCLAGLIVFGIPSLLVAQINMFPLEGNVGIGTTNPQTDLHYLMNKQKPPQLKLTGTAPSHCLRTFPQGKPRGFVLG